MRARLFIVSSLAVAAVLGASGVAHAHPNGPGDISQKPTTTTTAPPKGPDDIAPKPTTSTTTPPKPKGPGDIANPQSDPVVDPGDTGNGSGSDLDYPTTMGDDEGGADTKTTLKPVVDETPQVVADTNTATPPAVAHESSHLPTLVIVLVAGLVGALLALLAGRFRRDDDEHVNQV
jgi:hypothetical protein